MNGAQSLMQTLVDGGVDVCFANPGTTEIHFLEACDQVQKLRTILGLHEGVCTGAADGYARMTGRPAATLLHHGAGLANGISNLHNARRAQSPIINIVGDNTTTHLKHDPPLSSDIAAIARTVGWVGTAQTADEAATVTAAAIQAARTPPGQSATVIVPADCAWNESRGPVPVPPASRPRKADSRTVVEIAKLLARRESTIIFLGSRVLTEQGLLLAGRIAKATGARIMANRANARIQRGAGRVYVERLPYSPAAAVKMVESTRHLVLVGVKAPISFYAWPGQVRSEFFPESTQVHALSTEQEDGLGALAALAEELHVPAQTTAAATLNRPALPTGPLTLEKLWAALTHYMPEHAIISDEGISSSREADGWTTGAPPHDWLNLAGGAIGQGMPVATGAAVACPGRKVFTMQSDGGGMYVPQALWTQAHENLEVITIIFANRGYKILQGEFTRTLSKGLGPKAMDMLDLHNPMLDWIKIAGGMGVEAGRAETAEQFNQQLASAVTAKGPRLIEAVL